jgi:hypothetical protein
MTLLPNFDPDKLSWELLEATPDFRRWIAHLEGDKWIQKTEYLGDEQLLKENKELLNDSYGKRFGDGVVAARIPLNVLYSSQHQIMEKMRQGDRDHLPWWLNRDENQPYRTFRGVVPKAK